MKSLAVDDEFVALSKLTTLLGEYGQCDAATNGFQAIAMYCKALADQQPYDLVTIDVEMREMDGLLVLKRLRREDARSGSPPARKIMISAANRSEIVMQAAANRCDAFLVKPIRREGLIRRLAELGLIPAEAAPAPE